MIIKMHKHYGDGWVWIDQIDKVDEHGLVGDGVFNSFADLSNGVEKMWGPSKDREFEYEVWPTWGGDNGMDSGAGTIDAMYGVRTVSATRRNGEHVLCVIHRDAYVLSDTGDTVDRL